MLEGGIIQHSTSPWQAQVVVTPLAPQNAGAPQNAYFQFSWISCPWKQEWWQFSVPISGLVFCLTNWANIFN